VVANQRLDVIAVEIGAPQLPFWHTVSPHSTVCLNIAEDHVDHFGTFERYVATKAKAYERTRVAAVYNAADPATLRMVEQAEVVEGCRAIGFTLGTPGLSELGVVEDLLVDRAFVEDRRNTAQELASLDDVHPRAPHQVANALAAAALARAWGAPPAAVRDGLRNFRPAAHRIAHVATIGGVQYIDDSKATNAHAAQTSLAAFDDVVWIAGGMAKGQAFDELVQQVADRLRAVVLLGVDRGEIEAALRRHAPDVPRIDIDRTDTGAMAEVVAAAAAAAQPGDCVLLAPGCASWDMFRNYGHRGDAFAEAVQAMQEGRDEGSSGTG
jgi:UDP-N-acetylmuramoylalanine--D-glutamate ligase